MIMIMNFRIMSGMVMIVRSVVPGVIMVVHVRITTMRVLMFVFMEMIMGVDVGVFVCMPLTPRMDMFMRMCVRMVMPVHMFVFMSAFHNYPSFHRI